MLITWMETVIGMNQDPCQWCNMWWTIEQCLEIRKPLQRLGLISIKIPIMQLLYHLLECKCFESMDLRSLKIEKLQYINFLIEYSKLNLLSRTKLFKSCNKTVKSGMLKISITCEVKCKIVTEKKNALSANCRKVSTSNAIKPKTVSEYAANEMFQNEL